MKRSSKIIILDKIRYNKVYAKRLQRFTANYIFDLLLVLVLLNEFLPKFGINELIKMKFDTRKYYRKLSYSTRAHYKNNITKECHIPFLYFIFVGNH